MRLGSVCTKIGSGATPRGGSEVYHDSGPYALIRSQNIYNDGFRSEGLAFIGEEHAAELSNVEVLPEDVLLNITGDSVARCCQVDDSILPARVNQHVAIIRPDSSKLFPRFLRYFLISPEIQAQLLSWAGSGGTRNALTKLMIESFEVLAPKDVDEQRAIAHILGTLDDKIELNRRINETLEAMARAIFKSWFVDFDPVHVRRGDPPWSPKNRAGTGACPYMTQEILDLFPDSFKDSELGEIPEGWEVWRVADVGNVICGKTPATSISKYYSNNDVPFITIPDMHGKIFVTTTQKSLSSTGAASQQKKTLPAGTLCVSCIATPGLVVITSEESQTNQQINSVIPNRSGETYFWFWRFRHLGDEIIASGSGGSVVTNLSTQRFSELRVLASPNVLRSYYNSLVAPLFDKIMANERESRTLAALRDTLLPKLISGELRVKDAERMIGGYQ